WWTAGEDLSHRRAEGSFSPCSERQDYPMAASVQCQTDAPLVTVERRVVELRLPDAAIGSGRVLDADGVAGFAQGDARFEGRPFAADAGIEEQPVAFAPYAENAFDAGAVHPAGRACVPGPAAAAVMWRDPVDVRR